MKKDVLVWFLAVVVVLSFTGVIYLVAELRGWNASPYGLDPRFLPDGGSSWYVLQRITINANKYRQNISSFPFRFNLPNRLRILPYFFIGTIGNFLQLV